MTDAVSTATNTAPRPESRDVACGTVLSGPELQEVVVLFEKLATAEVAAKTATRLLNEERSQRMVAEQLVKIVQSDLSIVQQGNAAEVTERMRLETELSSVKVSLSLPPFPPLSLSPSLTPPLFSLLYLLLPPSLPPSLSLSPSLPPSGGPCSRSVSGGREGSEDHRAGGEHPGNCCDGEQRCQAD